MQFQILRCAQPQYLPSFSWTNAENITNKVTQAVQMSLRGTKELNGARFTFYSRDGQMYSPLAAYKVNDEDWVGFEQFAKVNSKLWKVTVTLTEVAKIAEGFLLDGFANTQPRTGAQTSLMSFLLRILRHVPALQDTYGVQVWGILMPLDVRSALYNTVCPQFKFNSQTTLWEALLEIGNCIGAIPKVNFGQLFEDEYRNLYDVSFQFATQSTQQSSNPEQVEKLVGFGQKYDEEQYNSNLSMIADNVLEE